jgi:hypothetical protein
MAPKKRAKISRIWQLPGWLLLFFMLAACVITPVVPADGAAQPAHPNAQAATAIPAASASLTATRAAMPGHDVTIYGGDEAALREFLRYFFIQTFAPVGESATAVYIGSLPPDLSFELEVPDNLHVTGSVVTSAEYSNTHILFSVDGDVGETMAALRQQVEQQGYTTPPGMVQQGVFVTASPDYMMLCSADSTLAVTMSGRNLGDGTGVVRFYIEEVTAFGGACMQREAPQPQPFDDILPTLAAPVAISVFSSEGGGGGNSYETTIRFSGETTVVELIEHYNAQMADQGWQQLSASQSELMAWSGWSLSKDDRTYIASLYVAANAENPNRFQTTLRLDQAP